MEVLRKAVSNTSKTRHSKLPENWGEIEERVIDGVTFHLKYLGSILVEELERDDDSYGDTISAEAIRTIVAMAKASGKKLPKMAVTISPHGIQVVDMLTKEVKTDLSIYRISFCTADKNYEKIFGYIARNTDNETMECHAFLSPKKKIAEAVTLTVSEAFKLAKQQEQQKQSQDATHQPEKAPAESSSQPQILISSDQCRITQDTGFSSSTAGNTVTLGFEDNFTDLSCFASSRPGVVPWQSSSSDTESYSKDDVVTLQPWRPIEELSPQSSVDDLLLL